MFKKNLKILSDDELIEYFENVDELWFDCEKETSKRMDDLEKLKKNVVKHGDKIKHGKRYWKLFKGIPERYD